MQGILTQSSKVQIPMYRPNTYRKNSNRRTRREDRQLLQGIILITALAIFAGLLFVSGILH